MFLDIKIVGLCAFVRDGNLVHVVMPNTERGDKTRGGFPLPPTFPQHLPYLVHNSSQRDQDPTAQAAWQYVSLYGRTIQFLGDATTTPQLPSSMLDIGNALTPHPPLPPELVVPGSMFDPANGDLTSRVSFVTLPGGVYSCNDTTTKPFSFGNLAPTQFCTDVTWTTKLPDSTSGLTLQAPLMGGGGVPLNVGPLYPDSQGRILVELLHMIPSELASSPDPMPHSAGKDMTSHFDAYYRLFPNYGGVNGKYPVPYGGGPLFSLTDTCMFCCASA